METGIRSILGHPMQYSIRNLSVTAGSQLDGIIPLLHDISLDFVDNECIGLLGPSGAGKTQLSYALSRLNIFRGCKINCDRQSFVEGELTIDLGSIDLLEAFRSKSIGYIFQEAFSYFNPILKIKAQLEGIDAIEVNELEDLFKACGIYDVNRILSSYPHQLSGGQLQRIAIIQCLLRNPSIIIADEIESALDADNAKMMMKLLLDLKARRAFTLIWITHDQQKAQSICERIWYVEGGQLIYDGPSHKFKPIHYLYPASSSLEPGTVYIKLEHISKSFSLGRDSGKLNILDSVSLTINQNEVIGLIGSSGSGKSTLAKIIAGLISPDHGNVYIDGVEITPPRKPDKTIQYIFQDAYSSLNPSWTVQMILKEAIDAGNNAYNLKDLLNKGALDEDVLNVYPSALSGGMKQRVAILRAIAVKPRVLILDESLNAMDHALQVKILNMLMSHIKETKMSMVVVSHQENLVNAVCGRIYSLDSGILTLH
jgi:ABC-type dipeptide/oligopeptide/nickel transport system ATPase subunit